MPTELEEKDAIRELMAEYCFCLDNDRFADMAALFTEDGTWDTAFGKGTGHDGVEALVRRLRSSPGARHRAIHHVTNIVIKLDGNARDRLLQLGDGAEQRAGAEDRFSRQLHDDLVKQDGQWLFHYRKIDRFIHDKA